MKEKCFNKLFEVSYYEEINKMNEVIMGSCVRW